MIFGQKRRRKTAQIDWPRLQALLEDDDRRAAVEKSYPDPGNESFLSALRRVSPHDAETIQSLGRQVQHGERLANFPTLAIAGMLNSGKTSLVASLLSESGRVRTLRGVANREGTHRFVLWLPEQWRHDESIWQLLLEDFGNAVGSAPELLSDSVEQAHQQYNNRSGDADALGVPLVATDPALDEMGIGLLDCPDIVSDEAFGVGSPERRRELLGKAATFCSAFLVLSTPSMARDRTMSEILATISELMPGIPRYLAINKIRPNQSAEDILESFQHHASKFQIERIYGAYDFEIPASEPFIPKTVDDEVADTIDDGTEQDGFPVFFSLSASADENPPTPIAADRLLTHLPSELDRPESSERFLIGRQTALRRAIWDQGLPVLEKAVATSMTQSERARRTLLETTISLFAKTEAGGNITELRLHQSERIVRQLTDAMCEAAPWYARWGVRINTFIQSRTRAATDLLKRYAPTSIAESYAESIKEKFKSKKVGQLVDPADLDTSLRRFGAPLTLPNWFSGENDPVDANAWQQAMHTILEEFDKQDRTQFDGEQLSLVAEDMWKAIPKHRKLALGLTPLAAMLAAFGSVLMIPFDFGTTILVANASIVEILAAAGLTAFATYWAGGKNAQMLSSQAAVEQMSMFYAILCHRIGVATEDPLPSVEVKQTRIPFPPPKVHLGAIDPVVRKPLAAYRMRETFQSELAAIIPRNQ